MLPVPPGHVRTGPLRCIPALIREFGIDPDPVCRTAGLDPGHLLEPENHIHYNVVLRLLERAAEATRCGHFGMLTGTRCAIEDLGVVGLMAAQAPTVGAALNDFVRHISLFDKATELTLTVAESGAQLSVAVPEHGTDGATQALELVLAVSVRVLRELAGPDWSPATVLLAGPAPRTRRPYADFFRAPLISNASVTGVTFASRWLDHPVRGSLVLRRHLAAYVQSLSDEPAISLAERVSRQIRASASLRRMNEETLARGLGMDASTLRRRLARENTGFRALLEAAYRDRAQQLMRVSDLNLTQVAAALGYAELSVFTRAFRRWTGMSPTEWRRRSDGADRSDGAAAAARAGHGDAGEGTGRTTPP